MTPPPLPTIHDKRDLLPPDPEKWEEASIVRAERDGNAWHAILTMGFFDYWVRAYRMDDGTVRFQFQARRCARGEAAFLAYLDGLGGRMAG